MIRLLSIYTIISGISFLVYGALCIFSGHMEKEFQRYELLKFRKLVGVLEFLGGLGVLWSSFSDHSSSVSSWTLATHDSRALGSPACPGQIHRDDPCCSSIDYQCGDILDVYIVVSEMFCSGGDSESFFRKK